MNLRRLALSAAGGLGAAVATNAALARRAGPLEPPLPGTHRSHRFRGMDAAYTEAGEGGDVLLVHGINAAATSYEWAPIFDGLADGHRAVAPDLPGFGCSSRPPIAYDAELYTSFVGRFAEAVAPGAVCVASSLSGAYAILAQRERAPFSGLVLVCPTGTTTAVRRPRLRRLLRSPVVGTTLFNALASRASIRNFDADHAYFDPGAIPDDEVAYQWRSAHQEGARFAPASFVSGYLDPDVDLAAAAADLDVPVTLIWGRDADITPLSYGRDLAAAADAKLVVFDRAKLLPHVEHAPEFLETLSAELDRMGE